MTTHTADVGSFSQILEIMAGADFFTGLLPFVISYIVFFLALQRVPLFQENDDQDKFAALISIVFAFFVARFISLNPVYQDFFVEYIGFVAVTILGLLGLMITLAMIGIKIGSDNTGPTIWGFILGLIILSGFLVTGGANLIIPQGTLDTRIIEDIINFTIQSGLIWVLVVGGVIAWTLKPEDTSGDENESLMALSDLFESVGNSSGD